MLTTTVGGSPHDVRGPVLRSTARPGDTVWVTGTLGRSLASGRHLTFEPRIAEAAWLCDLLGDRLHAMIDLSDGLGRDAGRLAAASNVRIELDHAALPRHADATDPLSPLRDGEDYELCLTIAADVDFPTQTPQGTRLTRVGRVVAGEGCIAEIDGRSVDVADLGWDHIA
jgi:thiamine-monophosphate kinase